MEIIKKAFALDLSGVGITPVESGSLLGTIDRVLTWLLGLAGALAVIYLIYGGILYITAGGDAEKATKGRTALVNAIIGIIIIALAMVIVKWVVSIINSGTA
jgi:hypothetical protein